MATEQTPSEQSVRRAIGYLQARGYISKTPSIDVIAADFFNGEIIGAIYRDVQHLALAFDAQDTAWQAKLAEAERETREADINRLQKLIDADELGTHEADNAIVMGIEAIRSLSTPQQETAA